MLMKNPILSISLFIFFFLSMAVQAQSEDSEVSRSLDPSVAVHIGSINVQDVFAGFRDQQSDYFGGGTEYDQINYEKGLGQYRFERMPNGQVRVHKRRSGGYDLLDSIEGVSFGGREFFISDFIFDSNGERPINYPRQPVTQAELRGEPDVQDVFRGFISGQASFYGAGFEDDQIDYSRTEEYYRFERMPNGQVHVHKRRGDIDILDSIEGIWFRDTREYFSVSDLIVDETCLLYTSPSPRDRQKSRMPSSA